VHTAAWKGAAEPSMDALSVLHVYADGALDPPARPARLAAWINAYNRLVADGIVTLGIRQTVWDVPDFFDRICLRAGALLFSANDIEHGVLRGNRPNPLSGATPFPEGDPRRRSSIVPPEARIHFAINCGARSCPPARLYHPETLDDELEEATRSFVNRDVALEGGVISASPIFQWFGADFAALPGGLSGFLARYLADEAVRRALLDGGEASLSWRSYDWRVPREPSAGH
jgi:uncharacterized protein DUF547